MYSNKVNVNNISLHNRTNFCWKESKCIGLYIVVQSYCLRVYERGGFGKCLVLLLNSGAWLGFWIQGGLAEISVFREKQCYFYKLKNRGGDYGGFHLYLFELAYQFYSRTASLFQQSVANDKFRNHFTISSKYFDVASYWKQEAYPGPISFEVVKWQLNWFIWVVSSS